MVFSKNDLEIIPNIYYILTHFDVLMLCRKFDLILTSNFIMAILKMSQNLKIPDAIAHSFSKNGSKITSNFYYIF